MGIKKIPLICSALFCLVITNPLLSSDLPSVRTALVRVSPNQIPTFDDASDLDPLASAMEQSLLYYSTLPSTAVLRFGQEIYPASDLSEALASLVRVLQSSGSIKDLNDFIKGYFDVYRSLGNDGLGQVVFSAYYEHRFEAALSSSSKYSYPLYAKPKNRLDGSGIVPYPSREEIDSRGALNGQGLEIAWAPNPLDVLFLQIQGSGAIDIAESTQVLHIRYAGDNGRPYKSVGQYLIESGRLPKLNFSRDRMIKYLNAVSKTERQEILNNNPRYVFFEIISATNPTRGALMVPLTAGRSIASDPKIYPPGALAWLKIKPFSRFVLNQDEGGAIKGAGRIDFFAGGGTQAENFSLNIWSPGELYFFAGKRKH